jgi:hypothetical protein
MSLRLKSGERLVNLYNAKRTQKEVEENSLYAPLVILRADGTVQLVSYKGEGLSSYASEKDFIDNNEMFFED